VPCYAIFIIEVASIWIRKNNTILDTIETNNTNSTNSWGISLVIHAAQCLHSHIGITPLTPASIPFIPNYNMVKLASGVSTNIPPPPPLPPGNFTLLPAPAPATIPEYMHTYIKMIKMGIPRDAIKHKMIMAGHDPTELDTPCQSPKNNGHITSVSNNGPAKITANMLQGVKLKRCDDTTQHTSSINKPKINPPNGAFTVNLDELLSIKSRLKKANDTGQDTYSKIFKPLLV
jgi:hypothetical protein